MMKPVSPKDQHFVSRVGMADLEKPVWNNVYLEVYMKGPDCRVNEKQGAMIHEYP